MKPDLHLPPPAELPSPARLRRSALIAMSVAVVLLFVAVLPAEKGIDPTGLGRIIGLTQMGEVKNELAQEMADEAAFANASGSADSLVVATFGAQSSQPAKVTNFTLPPLGEKEVTLLLPAGSRVVYAWWTTGGSVNYESHWTVPNGAADNPAAENGKRISAKAGILTTNTERQYVWTWRNAAKAPVIISLRTSVDSVRVLQ